MRARGPPTRLRRQLDITLKTTGVERGIDHGQSLLGRAVALESEPQLTLIVTAGAQPITVVDVHVERHGVEAPLGEVACEPATARSRVEGRT